MALNEVYSQTTAPNPESSWFTVPSHTLGSVRFVVKVCEVLLSLVAFVLEELVQACSRCSALYLFEFVSCTTFIFTLALLVILATTLQTRVGGVCWPRVDLCYTALAILLLFIASTVYSVQNGNSTIEKTAVAFGFLATVAFIVDVGLFLKFNGLPWKTDGTPKLGHGDPVEGGGPPEKEKLTTPLQA
ncbi:CKLF-like MARVEL transmembrane domain-containing protein 6 isoform X1 [Antennarius striatus]|uniref:CKLF-like MARVEL transmembrane domain-containing protein 6 isoform X1 n=1 Tax=Antennarius striatus TaxID=241820 RepID=UPI0035AE841F